MDFAALAPEVISGRMYAGPGSGSMMSAAAAWARLAAETGSAARGYQSALTHLTDEGWLGPASQAMAAAATPYVAWLDATAALAEQTAARPTAAAAAFDEALAAVVPSPVIAANRATLAGLVATNLVGQNSAAIAALDAEYAQQWVQDAVAMYGYAARSAAATALTPFTEPPATSNLAGPGGQAGCRPRRRRPQRRPPPPSPRPPTRRPQAPGRAGGGRGPPSPRRAAAACTPSCRS